MRTLKLNRLFYFLLYYSSSTSSRCQPFHTAEALCPVHKEAFAILNSLNSGHSVLCPLWYLAKRSFVQTARLNQYGCICHCVPFIWCGSRNFGTNPCHNTMYQITYAEMTLISMINHSRFRDFAFFSKQTGSWVAPEYSAKTDTQQVKISKCIFSSTEIIVFSKKQNPSKMYFEI